MNERETSHVLDTIMETMIHVVENSKIEIVQIIEETRQEYEVLYSELAKIKKESYKQANQVDQIKRGEELAKQRLSDVSKFMNSYSENEIREVYEENNSLQADIHLFKEKQKEGWESRDDIEGRLIALNQTIDHAEFLANKISAILPYLHDEFRQVHDTLEEVKGKKQFGLKIIVAQEEERKKISRDIHDGPAQMLAHILLNTEIVERSLQSGNTEYALEEIQSIRGMLRTSLHEVRRIIYDLRPMALDDLGLIPTIKKYINKVADYNEKDIDFVAIGKERRFEQEYEVALFRLVQESLQNAIKHAKATLINVRIEMKEESIMIDVIDDGIGFNPKKKYEKSFGLIGIRERVDMLGGQLTIDSVDQQGTQIQIETPYNNEKCKIEN
ncbi:MAG TPA: histidine kinase [Virgibacillus sp.]|nr:histidine kinase [Virgibacillus sp.]